MFYAGYILYLLTVHTYQKYANALLHVLVGAHDWTPWRVGKLYLRLLSSKPPTH